MSKIGKHLFSSFSKTEKSVCVTCQNWEIVFV